MTIRFRDSATGDANVCAGEWFDKHLVEGIRAFRGQFGFFRFGALMKYAPALTGLAASGGPVRLVLGSNLTDPLTLEDVESVLSITCAGKESGLTVVALRNALFHPKVAHIVRSDGSVVAMVGSANLTANPTGKLRLGRAGHDIDQNTWFRHVMFANHSPTRLGSPSIAVPSATRRLTFRSTSRWGGRESARERC